MSFFTPDGEPISGPGGPEDVTPGPYLWLSQDQLRAITAFASEYPKAELQVHDAGAGYLRVRALDPERVTLGERLIPAY